VLMPTYPWTGGVGWLASYMYDHYLFTQDRFIRGTLKGVKARGGITVEQLHWNKTLGHVKVILRSEKAQSVKLRFGIDLRFVNAVDDSDRHRVSYQKKGQWNISLPAGRSVGLNCRF